LFAILFGSLITKLVPKAKITNKTLVIKYLIVFIILRCSLSNSLCAGADSFIKFDLTPSSPLLKERGQGAEKTQEVKERSNCFTDNYLDLRWTCSDFKSEGTA